MDIDDQFLVQVSAPEFVAELHHLCHIKPFTNRGQQELGWSCRDHTMILALVAALLRLPALLVTGQATFVQGPVGARGAIGLQQSPHSWLRTNAGTVDMSWRLQQVRAVPQWRPWAALGVIEGKVQPPGSAHFISTSDRGSYQHAVNAATHLADRCSAIYLSERSDGLTPDLVEQQYSWVNSPLTDRVRKIGQCLYSAAALHLANADGSNDSLRSYSQEDAWRTLEKRYSVNQLSAVSDAAARTD